MPTGTAKLGGVRADPVEAPRRPNLMVGRIAVVQARVGKSGTAILTLDWQNTTNYRDDSTQH